MSLRAMNWVWEKSSAAGNARLVLLALADHANDAGHAWPSIQRIADRTQLSERTVQRMINELADNSEISIARSSGGRASNTYIIHCSQPQEISHLHLRTSTMETEKVPAVKVETAPQVAAVDPMPAIDHEAVNKVLVGLPWNLGQKARSQLALPICEALRAGWSVADLTAYLGANPDGIKVPHRFLAARLDDLPPPPARPKTPEWCGSCDQTTRQVELPDGRQRRCAICHPIRSMAS